MPFATHGGLAVRHMFPLDGEYVFTIRLKRNGTVETINGIEEDEHEIELRVDSRARQAVHHRWQVSRTRSGCADRGVRRRRRGSAAARVPHDRRRSPEVRVPIDAGQRLVTVAFSDSAPSPHRLRGKPGVDRLFVSGPFNGTVPDGTPSRSRIFTCRASGSHDEEPCAREIIAALARRAYRRPVTDSDVNPLLTVYQDGRRDGDFNTGIERALEALLSMPGFLLRVERQPADVAPGQVYALTDLELASRLSFFLWRSIPDDELLDVAAEGRLTDPAILSQQVRRLLDDRRATRFMNDFIGQWLQIRNIHAQAPDGALFAGFNDTLRKAMVRETELFFESQVREDRPVTKLLRADYTYLNEQLARHYGVEGIYGSRFRRATWTDDRRHGLLGHASLLTVTSYANRTSVVLRGKWVLENLLGAPPPPPPPNVPPLKENDGTSKPTALRERMEQHRSNPVCASCHTRMDRLGFALEHFDAIGRWRETDR